MSFNRDLAAVRFGTGLSPHHAAPAGAQALLDEIAGPDRAAQRFPIKTFLPHMQDVQLEVRRLSHIRKSRRGTDEGKAADKAIRRIRKQAQTEHADWLQAHLARAMTADVGFRERLHLFWGDHFTARGKQGALRQATSMYAEQVIRPHIAGRFEEMLIAAVTHPLMLLYLDQARSMGPNSEVSSTRRTQGRPWKGLNENLAREVLELHTLGVGGPYTQTDVTELAELLTGFTYDPRFGPVFRPGISEPGVEVVLGKTYGGAPEAVPEEPQAALRDLARHPATARHMARKLAVHFVSDTPDPALIDHVAARWLETGGDLVPVYAALLEHPSAWTRAAPNIKQPLDFLMSSLRALDVPVGRITGMEMKETLALLAGPLAIMGQTFERPVGPDGWPEDDAEWITPQGIAGRLQWAMQAPRHLLDRLPDPRDFVEVALGSLADGEVRFAARAAESRSDGVGLVLASPAFQRR